MRLAGQIKCGYYPTPDSVTQDIIRILNFKGNVKILDPCCGEGKVLADFKAAFPACRTYGVELDSYRYETAKRRVDECLNCSSTNELRATNGAFDVLYENPPYDYDSAAEDEKSVRLEKRFLQAHLKYLKSKNGILIYVIPFSVLKVCKTLLERLYDLQVLAFPEEEYERFRQVVVIGRTENFCSPENFQKNREYLKKVLEVPEKYAYEYIPTTRDAANSYEVYSTGTELKSFNTIRINPDEVVKFIENSPLSKFFNSLCEVKTLSSIRPLTDLSEGHTAMLIASGMVDGLLQTETERLVIKGLVEESFKTRIEYEEEKEKMISTKQYKAAVNVLDLNNEKFFRVVA